MNPIPSSIETYLQEAGFSSTELLVLRNLIDEAFTLRQLAAKTGKSTGVLDQAIKKLLRRNIVAKEWVNDTHKYRLVSLQAIAKWVEEDTKKKQLMLQRRHQNFEAFINSLDAGQKRPEMHYFEGVQGMERAYEELLEHGKELLHYFPVVCSVEDDPMRDFRVQLFRKRRARGIFARYIVPDTPLGRRFATRDPFEYRKTLLVPEDQFTMSFEKVVADDIVACFNHTDKVVCFICYKELAETERKVFERAWKGQSSSSDASSPSSSSEALLPQATQVPLSTRALSSLREFFLSRKSLALFAVFALVAAGVTYGLYRQNVYLNTQRIRERAMSIAATGAMQFKTEDLEKLQTAEDVERLEYARVLVKLNEIRAMNDGVEYAWIMRPTDEENVWEFVADADSLDPTVKKDLNQDGIVDEADVLSPPGDIYTDENQTIRLALNTPYAEESPTTDQWGSFISGMAPVKDDTGTTIAVFGVDVESAHLRSLMRESFNVTLTFLGFFLLFVFIRLAAFNKSLFMEVWQVFNMRKALLSLALAAEIAFFVTLGLYYYTLQMVKAEMGQKVMAIAATAASQFDPDDIAQIHFPRDMEKEAYQRVFATLNELRDQNPTVYSTYIIRPMGEDRLYQFVADVDVNVGSPYWTDFNADGQMEMLEIAAAPGTYYVDTAEDDYLNTLSAPAADKDFVSDVWGTWISGFAPIRSQSGEKVGILGVDVIATDVYAAVQQRYLFSLWFIGSFLALVVGGLIFRLRAVRR